MTNALRQEKGWCAQEEGRGRVRGLVLGGHARGLLREDECGVVLEASILSRREYRHLRPVPKVEELTAANG